MIIKKTRKNKKNRLNKTRKHRGGSLIGQGTYGCIFSPSLKCKNEQTRRKGISKLLTTYGATTEIENYKYIDKIDPYGIFHIPLDHICDFDLENIDKKVDGNVKKECELFSHDPLGKDMKLLFFRDGGLDWNSYFTKKLNTKKWNLFFSGCYRLFYGLYVMSKHRFIHFDIKWNNILIDPKTLQSSLIDFGISQQMDTFIHEAIEQNSLFGHLYYHFNMAPEITLYTNFVPIVGDIIKQKLDNPSQIQYLPNFVKYMEEQYKNNKITRYWDEKLVSSKYYKVELFKKQESLRRLLKVLFKNYEYKQDNNEYVVFKDKNLLYKLLSKYDTYALGYSLCWLWMKYFKEPFSLNSGSQSIPLYNMRKLIHKMIQPNPLKRINPKKALSKFIIIWAKFIKSGIENKELDKNVDGIPKTVIKIYKEINKDAS